MSLDDEWMDEAACADLGEAGDALFFPPKFKGVRTDYRLAKGMCETCPVRAHCLSFAVAHRIPYGVWGGMSERERARIPVNKRRQIRAAWAKLHPRSKRDALSAGRG